MEWHPVIQIEIDTDTQSYRRSAEGAEIGFKRRRFYLSQSPAGDIYEVDWNVDENHRKAQMTRISGDRDYSGRGYGRELKITGLPLGAPFRKGDDEWLIDYDEALWSKFEQIVAAIFTLRRQLREIVGTKQGLAQLLTGGREKLLLTSKI